ncbi:MAG: uracil-DNA glycosylase [Chloroflexi bacterium]|nr:uracil-DNA glycosylase [Chloroflexota bacterium]
MQSDQLDHSLHFDSLTALVTDMMAMNHDPLFPAGTNMVIYRGNPEAKFMVIGEAPGPEENKQGKPFVGRSGQLLDQILQAVKLDSEKDVFISNSVFRLPPGDAGKSFRKPTNQEIAFYRPYTLEIVRLVDPKVIILTGGVAAQSVLNETQGITKIRGKWYEWQGRWVMPVFHPSYLLRNPSREPGSPKALTWQDIQAARQKYDELM